MRKHKSPNGFTLAELLIVVAIIAILVAISIPVFTAQLKKSRLAVDEANIREAYSLMQYAKITEEITNNVIGAAGYGRIKILDDYHILHI